MSEEGGFGGGEIEVTEEQIAQELGGLVPADKKAAVVRKVTRMMQRSHQGPLPAPDDFAHYNQTLPGGAERIMRLTEREQAHRHKMETRLVSGEYGTRYVGQIAAILALAMLVSLVGFCAYIGQPLAASVIAAIGGIIIAFLKYSAQRVDRQPASKAPVKQPRKKK